MPKPQNTYIDHLFRPAKTQKKLLIDKLNRQTTRKNITRNYTSSMVERRSSQKNSLA